MPNSKKNKKSGSSSSSKIYPPSAPQRGVDLQRAVASMTRHDHMIVHLFNCASDGTPQEIKQALKGGIPYDQPCPNSGSPTVPLNIAAQYQKVENLAVLAQQAMKDGKEEVLNGPNYKGRSAAYLAVEKANPEMLGVMAKAGANLCRAIPVTWQVPGTKGLTDPDPKYLPVHHALNQTVISHVSQTCIHCFKNRTKSNSEIEEKTAETADTVESEATSSTLMRCSSCRLAMYCSRECQKANWSQHKIVCKRIKKGSDLVTTPNDIMPNAKPDPHGFTPFQPSDHDTSNKEEFPYNPEYGYFDKDGEPLINYTWEYYDSIQGTWFEYPKPIQWSIERLQELGSPRYMYKPGDKKAEGREEREISRFPPLDVATQHVYYSDMIERHVYTGAGRRIRRRRRKKVDGKK